VLPSPLSQAASWPAPPVSDPPPGVPGGAPGGTPHETPARVEVPVQIVVGLGNPGVRYEGTRHNIGFDAVAALLGDRSVRTRHFEGGLLVQAEIAGRPIGLLRPMGYMNRSGGPVRRLLESEGRSPEETLVVCDDYALPLGTIRTRRRGSDGGHNGMASILSALRTDEIPRMRLGIGSPPAGEDPADFVLSHFAPQEAAAVDDLLERAVRAIETAVGQGIETAMNRFNRAAA